MGSNPGLGSYSYPGPEPGRVFSQQFASRGGATDDEAGRKEGEARREKNRRALRRKKADLRVKTWMKHPDDFE